MSSCGRLVYISYQGSQQRISTWSPACWSQVTTHSSGSHRSVGCRFRRVAAVANIGSVGQSSKDADVSRGKRIRRKDSEIMRRRHPTTGNTNLLLRAATKTVLPSPPLSLAFPFYLFSALSSLPPFFVPCLRPCFFSPPAPFAGRELSKLAIAWQAAAYGSDSAVFTPDLMASVTDTFLHQKVRCLHPVLFFVLCV